MKTKLTFVVLFLDFIEGLHAFMIPYTAKEPFLQIPYGRSFRGILSEQLPAVGADEIPVDLSWWQSISRNNTIDCECGVSFQSSSTDLWNEEGTDSLNVYPWSVSLVAPGSNYAFCGGTLVNDRFVLTSASCVDGSSGRDVEVLVGSWPAAHFPNITDSDNLNPISMFRKKVHRVILHPRYEDTFLDYNIALLRLNGPVPTFGNKGGISPVCLPSSDSAKSFDGQNSSSLIWRFNDTYGFIIPVKRTEVDSIILSENDCKSYNYSDEWSNMPDTIMCSRMEMTMNENNPYKESWDCPGDAGGFLVVNEGHQKVQVGIDAWTACFGRPKGIGIYTRVSEFIPWISLHISEDGRHCAR